MIFKSYKQNKELRKIIVDLADMWDGKESMKYGKRLLDILHKLDIYDTPEFYDQRNINRILKAMIERRKK